MRTVKLLRPDAWRAAPPSHGNEKFGALHPWLTSRGSLTARIVMHYSNFNLQRVAQRAQRPNIDERRGLYLREHELAIVREVLLRDGEKPLVFAHSVAVRRDLTGNWRGLSRLGARPLAEMLFRDPAVMRLPLEYKKLDRRHPLFRRAQAVAPFEAKEVWARRSVFLKHGRPLLVTEVFLTPMAKKERLVPMRTDAIHAAAGGAGAKAAVVDARKKRNILIVVDSLMKGGLARVAIDLLAGFKQHGACVGLLVLRPVMDYSFPAPDWQRVHAQSGSLSGLGRALHRRRLGVFIAEGIAAFEAECGTADLIIAAGENAPRCAARIEHPRLLLSFHSSQLQAIKGENWIGRWRQAFKIARRRLRAQSLLDNKNVHLISDGLAQELTGVLGVRPRSLSVIYNPFDLEGIRQLAMQATPQATAQVRPFIIGVGEFNSRKAFDRLIQAFSQCRFDGDLVLIGQGEEESSLRRLADKLGVAAKVKFLPFHENHYALLRKASLLVMTSRSEGFGNVLVEAMVLGVPALSIDCPHGPKDILSPFGAQALVPPDRIDLLPARIDELVVHPYAIEAEHVTRFSHEIVLNRYWQLIDTL